MYNISILTIWNAVARQGGAMEAGDHFKNGASSKSHTSRKKFLNYFAVILLAAPVLFAACDEKNIDTPKDGVDAPSEFFSGGGTEDKP